jgi:hypothetical protein
MPVLIIILWITIGKKLPMEKYAGIFNIGLSSEYWEIISLF